MKKLIKLLALIFLLTSCSSVKEIELDNDKPSTSVEHVENNDREEPGNNIDNNIPESNLNKPTDIPPTNVGLEKPDDKNDKDKKPDLDEKDEEKDKDQEENEESKDEINSEASENTGDEKDNTENNSSKPQNPPTSTGNDDKKPNEDKNSDTEDKNKPGLDKEENKDPAINKRPENADVLTGLLPNRIYYDGDSVEYLDIGIDNYNIELTQRYIDDGNIISTVTRFNPDDSEITYFSGHTYNYNNVSRLELYSVVTITDSNGIGYNYKIVDLKKYPAGLVDEDAPFIGGYHLMDLAGEGIGRESIVIQYCDENDVPIIFFGLPE